MPGYPPGQDRRRQGCAALHISIGMAPPFISVCVRADSSYIFGATVNIPTFLRSPLAGASLFSNCISRRHCSVLSCAVLLCAAPPNHNYRRTTGDECHGRKLEPPTAAGSACGRPRVRHKGLFVLRARAQKYKTNQKERANLGFEGRNKAEYF